MNVQIQSVHFDADKKLVGFINDKVNKLNHFHDGIIQAEVILKIDKDSHSENKIAELKLHIAGDDLFAKRKCKTFEEAVDDCVEAIRKQVQKNKEKLKGVSSHDKLVIEEEVEDEE
jgi:putative sigma-54 modulation protein